MEWKSYFYQRSSSVKLGPVIMEFKIDTKENYSRISSVTTHIDATMTAALAAQCQRLADNGSKNYLVDLSACQSGDVGGFEALAVLHEKCYSEGSSLVFININESVMQALQDAQMEGAINLAPTEAEGIDIIYMEILERDLLDEEG